VPGVPRLYLGRVPLLPGDRVGSRLAFAHTGHRGDQWGCSTGRGRRTNAASSAVFRRPRPDAPTACVWRRHASPGPGSRRAC